MIIGGPASQLLAGRVATFLEKHLLFVIIRDFQMANRILKW